MHPQIEQPAYRSVLETAVIEITVKHKCRPARLMPVNRSRSKVLNADSFTSDIDKPHLVVDVVEIEMVKLTIRVNSRAIACVFRSAPC